MRKDITLEGRHARIIKEFNEKEFFAANRGSAEIFFLAVLIGLYEGKTEELDIGGTTLNISRTWLNNPSRANFKHLINMFANLEQKFNGIDLTLTQIFLDEEETDKSDKLQFIKNHGYAGLEIMQKEYLIDNEILDKLDALAVIEDKLITIEEIDAIEIKANPVINTIDDILESE